ncbi:MAG: penicillin acylase family protein [Thermoanaerobaculales bacterium]|nr:penicillin acylase family protein [Thermoanaerobaculales bacterium]
MKLDTQPRAQRIGKHQVEVRRGPEGVARIAATGTDGLACALGAVHAHDRQVQMIMTRIIGQGRICELLADSESTFAIDVFMRSMAFACEAEREVEALSPEARRFAEAYAAGVNHVLADESRPLELRLVRHRPEPWRVADTLLTIKLMSYLGLAQSQQDMEKLIIQTVHGGGDVEALRRLLAPHLDSVSAEEFELVRGLAHIEPLLPPEVRFLPGAPKVCASNNWAVSGEHTASGAALQCNDPHLEVNRLPAVWYEAEMHTPQSFQVGITMPGVPGLVMGRTRDLSFGFTYGFMDMVDFFVEECRNDGCRRGSELVPLDVRREVLLRRKHDDAELTFRENDLGVLEADPLEPELADGLYLTRAWSGHRTGCAGSLEIIQKLPEASTVSEARDLLRGVSISCNWVVADSAGNIGYQQSGLLPSRSHPGLFPVPAWDESRVWREIVPAELLHSVINPPGGVLATANDELNNPDGPAAVNLPMGSYRLDRIRDLLAARSDHDVETMAAIQNDVLSLQAQRLMEIWRPLLPGGLAGRLLAGWDCRYDTTSRGATLFEAVYHEVVARVCGERIFGAHAWASIVDETTIFADYYHLFDAVLFANHPFWWGDAGRETVLRAVFAELLTEPDPFILMPWGRRRQVDMTNIFFDGRLPRFLGFDHGPVELPGGRATVVQGGIFTAHGHATSFAPSWRFITDMSTDTVHTVLAGGPSGRRFSKWYTTDVERWLAGEYKTMGVMSDE